MQTKEQARALQEIVEKYLNPLQREMQAKGYDGIFTFDYKRENDKISSICCQYLLHPEQVSDKEHK